jgi:hypothetical protein
MSRKKDVDAVFDSRTRWPMAPDLPDFPINRIRQADDLIEEATLRLAAVDRVLAELQRRRQRRSGMTPAERKALRDQVESMRMRRDLARLELIELVELAELPVEFMGWA